MAILNLYAVAACFNIDGGRLEDNIIEVNCALAMTPQEALDWFSGYIEREYPPQEGYVGYTYNVMEIPNEVR